MMQADMNQDIKHICLKKSLFSACNFELLEDSEWSLTAHFKQGKHLLYNRMNISHLKETQH